MQVEGQKLMSLPSLKKGFLKKQNRSGLIRSWKQRYIVLELGILKYYEKISHINLPPYGEGLKGTIDLNRAHVIDKSDSSTYKILVNCSNDEDDLLVECENQKEHSEWLQSISYHCRFAKTTDKSIYSSNNINDKQFEPATVTNVIQENKGGGKRLVSKLFQAADDDFSLASKGIWVTPEPNFVIKCLHEITREKIFINLCHHESIPTLNIMKGSAKWPHMISGEVREITDDKPDAGDASSTRIRVVDVLVNPEISRLTNKDQLAKEEVCQKVLRHIKKYRNEQVNEQYKCPKILKRYKGDFQEIFIDASVISAASSKTILTRRLSVVAEDPKGNNNNNNSNNINEDYSTNRYADNDGQNNEENQPLVDNNETTNLLDVQEAARSIPYEIVAVNGVMAKTSPEKTAPGRVVSCGEIVYIKARAEIFDSNDNAFDGNKTRSTFWLQTTEGLYITERLHGTSTSIKPNEVKTGRQNKLLKPVVRGPMLNINIVKANFVERVVEGFSFLRFFSRSNDAYTYETAFLFQIEYENNRVIKINRSIKQIIEFRKKMLEVAGNMLKDRLNDLSIAMTFMKGLKDGDEELLQDPEKTVRCIDSIDTFMMEIRRAVYPVKTNSSIAKRNASPQFLAQVNALTNFLAPDADDISLMEHSLLSGSQAI